MNHVFILQTSPDRYLYFSELVELAGGWTVLLLCAFYLQLLNHTEAQSVYSRLFQWPPILVWGLGTKRLLFGPAPLALRPCASL